MRINYRKKQMKNFSNMLKTMIVGVLLSFNLSSYVYAQNCWDFYRDRDFVKAIDCYNDYLKRNPKDADALCIRAVCYQNIGEYQLAFSDISNAIKYHNKKTFYGKDILYAQQGDLYVDIENYKEALNSYTKALKVNKNNTNVLFDRANLYYTMGDYSASDADWRRVIKIDNNNVNAQVGLARNMIARRQIDEAIRELNRLERIDPRKQRIYRYRCQAYDEKNNYRQAIDDLITWIYYDDIDRFKERFLLRFAEHEFIYLMAKISDMVVNDKDNDLKWLNIRIFLYEKHDMWLEAINDYNTFEELLSYSHNSIYLGRGICYTELGQYDKAIAEFDKGIDLLENVWLYLYRARAYRLKGDYKLAIADFNKVIELDPMNSYAYYMRGWTKEFDKDFQGALKDFTAAIELDREYAYTYVARGRLYQRILNQPLLAERDFLSVLSLESENDISKSGNCRQYALFHLGRIDDAIVHQKTILDKFPTSGNYYDAACLFSLMNRTDDAIKHLRIAFEKGYRNFIHLDNDADFEYIRNMTEFIELVNEWRNLKTD